MDKIQKFQSRVYLVNTGWTGGTGSAEGSGFRFPIPVTRSIITAITKGLLEDCQTEHLSLFNLDIPLDVEGVDKKYLNPRKNWPNQAQYDSQALALAKLFIENIVKKLGVMDAAISLTEIKDNKAAKKTDGRKSKNIRNIPKLIDANWAGGNKSDQCVLILCEGDSAKAGIVSGLSKEDRNKFGVFPLKGKLMNTKDILQSRLNDNAEITNIKKIIGLETGKEYTPEIAKKSLRYGHVMFMTDQDLDGSHIKGLCVNLFHSQWRDLLELDNFLGFMNTPIIKAKKGTREKSFYNESDYKQWKQANNNGKGSLSK